MNKTGFIHIALFITSLMITIDLFAQENTECSRILANTEEAFDQGRLLFILDRSENYLFYNCLDNNGFSKVELVRAYKLLTETYLFTDNIDLAEKSLEKLLTVDKEHQLTVDDPAELLFLYRSFKTEPIFRLSGQVGLNKSLPKVIQIHNNQKSYNQQGNDIGLGTNSWFQILIERHISKGVEIGFGANLWSLTYEMESGYNKDNNGLLFTAQNRSSSIRVPLLIKYNFRYNQLDNEGNRRKTIPYVFFGASFDRLLSARYFEARRSGGQAFSLPENQNNLLLFNQVRKSNMSFFLGTGIKLRFGRSKVDFLTFQVRYDNQLFNYINSENRWANSVISGPTINLVEDDLTLNAISLSAGYTRSFYLPRKRKNYR